MTTRTGDARPDAVRRPAARRCLAAATALAVGVPLALGVDLTMAAAAGTASQVTTTSANGAEIRVSYAPPVDRPDPGSATTTRGVDASYVPVGVPVAPGTLTQALLDAAPDGTSFALLPGVHRLTEPLRPRARQELHGHLGAVLSGARVLDGFVRDGAAWRVSGQTGRLPGKPGDPAPCAEGVTLCNAAEDVFLDDAPLRQVASRAELVPGTFFFDYAASSIYLADDPTGRRVDTTAASQAVVSTGGVVLRNLVVEKFGNPAQSGAIQGSDVDVVNCVVRLNHGAGVFTYGGSVVSSAILRNGQLGLGAGGDDMLVQNTEIAWNNTAGYDPGWEAGGTKWAFTNRLVVKDNWSHHNNGHGLWTDIDNDDTTYSGNLVEDNQGIGIFHEISYAARIVGNTVRNNGLGGGYFSSRVGINVTNSPGVEVAGNTVTGNSGGSVLVVQDGRTGAGRLGPRTVADISVHDNALQQSDGYVGLWVYDDVPDRASYYSARRITFSRNTYSLPSASDQIFLGGDAGLGADWAKSWTRWQALGQDPGSVLTG